MWVARETMGVPSAAAERGPASSSGSQSRTESALRNPYSAEMLTDSVVLERQSAVVEAMELDCARFRRNCAEARQARAYIDRMSPPE